MFGRKGLGSSNGSGRDSAPNNFDAMVAPGGKIDTAMSAAIGLFTRILQEEGRDVGNYAMPEHNGAQVRELVAKCITYEDGGVAQYATLGVTRDFNAFSYQPHCFLFLINNAAMIAEDLLPGPQRAMLAASQCREPLFHAHVMRQWIKHIRPVGKALTSNEPEALDLCFKALIADVAKVVQSAPQWLSSETNLGNLAKEWLSGYPGTIGRPLDGEVRRINNIPMTDFVAELLTDWMAQIQAQGLREQHKARMG